MKNISKFTVALVVGSLFAGWLISTILKPSNAGAIAIDPTPSVGHYKFISQPGLGAIYVFDTTQGKLYQFYNGPDGAPNWKKLGSPDDAK